MMSTSLLHLLLLQLLSSFQWTTASSSSSVSFATQSLDVSVDGKTVAYDNPSGINGDSSFSLDNDDLEDDVGEDFGVPQDVDLVPERFNDIVESLERARRYLAHFNFSYSRNYRRLQEDCRNKHELCALWAVAGECQKTPLYMNLTCAPMCHACEYLLPEVRCPVDPNGKDAWYPGDLKKMFERLATHPEFQKYEPTILSSPNSTANQTESGPWLLQLDHVFTSEQAHRWIEYGKEMGYEPSYLAARKENYAFDSTYCTGDCDEDAGTTTALMKLVEKWTGIPRIHYEHVNLLRYHVGQSSLLHTDYILEQREQQEGVRLLSILFYLNEVEEGGQTNFEHAQNISVTPKVGRVIIWPNVLDEDPNRHDPRTDHQAFAVTKGIKYAAYISIHQRDFKTPHSMHCATMKTNE